MHSPSLATDFTNHLLALQRLTEIAIGESCVSVYHDANELTYINQRRPEHKVLA
jgi:hypothetical protein